MSFGDGYASIYDSLYRDKNYAGEAEFVLSRFAAAGGQMEMPAILDVGCGTGQHAAEFLKTSRHVCGVDLSDAMLDLARQKMGNLLAEQRARLQLEVGDARTFKVERTFDYAVSLFHVMSYMVGERDFSTAVGNIRAHLREGGLFLFDFWYGPAVLAAPPEARERVIDHDGRSIKRITAPEWDRDNNHVRVNFDVVESDTDGKAVSHTKESHDLRYFFDADIRNALFENKFALYEIGEWLTGKPPTPSSFGVYALARAV